VSLTRAKALTAMSSPDHGGSGQSDERGSFLQVTGVSWRWDCSPLTARSYACNQAALMSSSPPEATLILVPASRAAPWSPTTQVGPCKERAFPKEPAAKAELFQ